MSLNATTLNGAVESTDTYVKLTSGTGAAVGKFVKVDSEFMLVQNIDASPVLKVARGQAGTLAAAHSDLATAVMGLGSDFPPTPVTPTQYTYTAAGAITIAPGTHILQAGAVAAMTLADPTDDQDGLELRIVAADAHAYTVSNGAGSGFNDGGAGTDVGTFGGAIGDNFLLRAINGFWAVLENTNVTLG